MVNAAVVNDFLKMNQNKLDFASGIIYYLKNFNDKKNVNSKELTFF